MKKLYIKYLSIEVTRRCNMACAHCIMGDAEELDIDHRHIRNLLSLFSEIQILTITGGEPSLNPKAIRYILKQLKHFGIRVYEFDVTTNGSKSSMSQDFIEICAELYRYQDNKEQNEYNHMLEMSDDRFHDNTYHNEVISALSKFPFFGLRGQSKHIALFKGGRCKDGYELPFFPCSLSDDGKSIEGDICLNAEGNIIASCNMSYSDQRNNILCHSGNLRNYLIKSRKAEKEKSKN